MTRGDRDAKDQTAAPFFSDRDRILSLAAVTMAAFGVGMSFGISFPLTSLTLEAWATPHWLIGIAGAAPSLAVLLVLPFLPRVVARWGVVRAIGLGCLFGAAGFYALSQFTSAWAWIVIRFIMSAGLALPWLAGETWINMVTKGSMRGRVIAIYAIAFFSGYSVGPVVLDAVGLTGAAPFAAGALSMALAGLPIVLAAHLAPDVSDTQSSRGVLAVSRMVPWGMAGGFIGGFAEMSYLSLLPNVSLAGGVSTSEALGIMSTMTLGGVAIQFAIGWLADTSAKPRLMIVLTIIFIALSLVLPLTFSYPLAARIVAFATGGIILGFYTLGLAIVGDVVPPRDLSAASAGFLIMYQIGAILGPAMAGAAMTACPVGGFVATMSGFMVAVAAVLAVRGAFCGRGG